MAIPIKGQKHSFTFVCPSGEPTKNGPLTWVPGAEASYDGEPIESVSYIAIQNEPNSILKIEVQRKFIVSTPDGRQEVTECRILSGKVSVTVENAVLIKQQTYSRGY